VKYTILRVNFSGILMNKQQLISEMLLLPVAAIDYHISQHLLKLFPDKALIESEGYLGVESFADAKHCTPTRKHGSLV